MGKMAISMIYLHRIALRTGKLQLNFKFFAL